MFRSFLVVLFASMTAEAAAPTPTASELLAAMDKNLQFETRTAVTKMTVVEGTRTREYRMQTYGKGEDTAAVEYLAPEREKGTRMLKLGDELWLYMPRAERVQKISGHMLRQGMMGSDLSYEDMMSGQAFEDNYTATVTGAEDQGGRPAWKVEAVAKNDTVTYAKRVIWIDQKTLIPVRQELFALSGMLLKTWTMDDVREIDGKQIPFHMVVSDALRAGSRTELTTEEMKLGVTLEDEVFGMRWLERK